MAKTTSEKEIKSKPRRYLLNPAFAFRGWKKLPYALQYLTMENTEFFLEDRYRLLLRCDGETDIHFEDLSQQERGISMTTGNAMAS